MGLILLIVLILALIGTLPNWPYAINWGYRPSGVVGVVLALVLLLLFLDILPWGFGPPAAVH